MKVLVVATMYPSSLNPSYGSFIKEQVEVLEQKGIACQVVANRDSRRGSLNALRKYVMLAGRVLVASIRQDFDVIHAHATFFAGIWAVLAGWLFRKPVIITVHGTDDVGEFLQENALQRRRRLATWLARTCLRRADHVIAVSHYLRDLIIAQLGISGQKISVIDMGVDTDVFRPIGKTTARNQLNLPLSDRILLYVGRLHPAKGINYLIEAVAQLDRPNCRLVLIGDGQECEKLQTLAHSLGVPVTFAGGVPKADVPLWMCAADVLAHPTLSEGFGLVVLEALSCGLPVVASRVGAIPEIIEDEMDGYLIAPADATALAAGISKCLENLEHFSAYGRQAALNHDVHVQAGRVLATYERTVAETKEQGVSH